MRSMASSGSSTELLYRLPLEISQVLQSLIALALVIPLHDGDIVEGPVDFMHDTGNAVFQQIPGAGCQLGNVLTRRALQAFGQSSLDLIDKSTGTAHCTSSAGL